MHSLARLLTVTILLLLFTAVGAANYISPDKKWQDFDAAIRTRMSYFSVPGAAVAIVDNGKLVMLKGYGYRDISKKLIVDENTQFQLASVSKFLLALSAGALVDQNKLQWNAPAKTYYPVLNLSDKTIERQVTLADFLSHRSGLQQFDGDDMVYFGYNQSDILARTRYLTLSGFRTKAQYSNVGFLLAGAVVGGSIASTWEQVVQSNLFTPLDMRDSTCHSTNKRFVQQHPDYSQPYTYDFPAGSNEPYATLTNYDPLGPAGSMGSNITDMSHLLLMLCNGGIYNGSAVLSAKALTSIYTPQIPNRIGGPQGAPSGNNCLGCNSYIFKNATVIEKDGLLNGQTSVISLVPANNSGIVILCNTDMIDFRGCVRELFLEYILGSTGKDLQKTSYFDPWRLECAQKNAPALPNSIAYPPPSLDLSAYCGEYSNATYGEFSITLKNNRLNVTALHNNLSGYLIPRGGDTFIWYWPTTQEEYEIAFVIKNNKVSAANGEWLGHLDKER